MKNVIIDPSHGGEDIGLSNESTLEKDLNLSVAKYIYNKLQELNFPVKLTRSSDINLNDQNRVDIINELYPKNEDTIVISIETINTNEGSEIIYALRNKDTLAEEINNQLLNNNLSVNKYYQRRLPSNTALDYNYLIRETTPDETIIIQLDILNNSNNYEQYVEAIVRAIANYTNTFYPNDNNSYIVKKGDSLYSIARTYNTSINDLKSINNLSSNLLSIGQTLKIPQTSSNIYTVKKGDSLYSIARTFNTSINDLKSINNLSSNLLSIGQTLKIPQTSSNNYTVKKGDSLYSIARTFNTSINDLKSINNLSSNLLSIGQILKIPQTSSNTYTVKKGDSLYSIARTYNTSVDTLKNINSLSTNLLSVGQILKLPN